MQQPNFGLAVKKAGRRSHSLNDAHQASVFKDGKTSSFSLYQRFRDLNEARVESRDDNVDSYHLLDHERIEHFALRVLDITKRSGQCAAKEIALRDNVSQLLPVIVKNRQVPDPRQMHEIVRESEFVVSFDGDNLRPHNVVQLLRFHAQPLYNAQIML
jgi:hypothetical protein